jgi:hypothetical protein
MFRSRFLMAAFVAAIAALAGPATSQAAFTIKISDGVNPDINISGSGSTYSNNNIILGGLNIQITVTNNSPGTTSNSQVSNTTLAISAANGAIAATTLTITVNVSGFANAAANTPANIHTSSSASTLEGTSNAFSTLNGSHIAGSDVSLPNGGGFGFKDSAVNTPSNPYSLGNTLVLSLDAFVGSKDNTLANVNVDSKLTSPGNLRFVPAPAGLILAATGLPFFGLLRRRMRRTETAVAA